MKQEGSVTGMGNRLQVAILVLIVAVFAMAPIAFAQTDRGTITGTVTDSTGAAVPGAHVTAVNTASGTRTETQTTPTGEYTLVSLTAGTYNVSIEASGFKKLASNGIVVQVAETERVDAKLEVGSATESIVVTGEAPLLKTENAQQDQNVSGDAINALPINFGGGGGATGAARDPIAFITLSPGVQQTAGYGGPSSPNGNSAVNGFGGATFRIYLDGLDETSGNANARANETQGSVDQIEEYSLQTSNFAPEFGQVMGGLVNYTMRSGSNMFHGSLYEYFANEDLDAHRPYTYVNPESRKNDFGGTLSGPVYIPKVYDGRNKTFFFLNMEEFINEASSSGIVGNMPTPAQRIGDFSALLSATSNKVIGTDATGASILNQEIYDPGSNYTQGNNVLRTPFPNNVIPQSRLDPVAVKIMQLVPQPTFPNQVTNNWDQLALSPKRSKLPGVKIDQIVTSKQRISFYLGEERIHQCSSCDGLPAPVTAIRDQQIHSFTYRLNYDYTIAPTVITHIGVGYVRYLNPDSSPLSVLAYPAKENLGLVGGAVDGFPELASLSASYGGVVDTISGFGPTNADHYWNDKQSATANTTWVHQSHTFKFGAQFAKDIWIDDNSRGSTGVFNFSPAQTGLPYLNTTTVGAGSIGNPVASMMLGQFNTATTQPVEEPEWRRPYWAMYAQDSWKVTPKLTLEYGIRWDWQSMGHEINYRMDEFGPYTQNPSAGNLNGGVIFEGYGAGRCNCTFTHAYPYGFAPRVGVAWQVAPNTVVRGGYGVVYGQLSGYSYVTNQSGAGTVGVGWNILTFNSPAYGIAGGTLAQGLQYSPSALTAVNLNPGILPTPGTTTAPQYYFDPQAGRPPRIGEWSLGIQHQLRKDLMVEANWVGNHGAWETANSATALNFITPKILAAHGLSQSSSNLTTLLTQQTGSSTATAAGISVPYTGFPTNASVMQALRPYPMYSSNLTAQWAPEQDSWYDSLQAKATKRYSFGLTGTAGFTWSKALATDVGTLNYWDEKLNKSFQSFDQPFLLVVGWTYEVPKIARFASNKLLTQTLTGWTLGGLLQYGSGLPIGSPGSLNNLSSVLGFGTYMNRNPGVPLYLHNLNCHCYDPTEQLTLNPAAWTDVGQGQFGNAAPYYSDYRFERRPGEQMSFGRTFRLGEHSFLSLRAEFFNVFNRTYLPNPSTSNPLAATTYNSAGVLTGGFGFVNALSGSLFFQPRNGQLVGRIQW
jgi:hypothetical protein